MTAKKGVGQRRLGPVLQGPRGYISAYATRPFCPVTLVVGHVLYEYPAREASTSPYADSDYHGPILNHPDLHPDILTARATSNPTHASPKANDAI